MTLQMTLQLKRTAFAILVLLGLLLADRPVQADDTRAEETEGNGVLVRYAVLLGTVDSEAPPPKNHYEAVDGLLEWDFQRDNDELMKLLGLRAIHTLQHSSVQLDRDTGEVAFSTGAGGEKIDVEMSLEVFRPELGDEGSDEAQPPYATMWFKVKDGGEVLSAPTVSSRLGERAIVSTYSKDKAWIIFLVVEVH